MQHMSSSLWTNDGGSSGRRLQIRLQAVETNTYQSFVHNVIPSLELEWRNRNHIWLQPMKVLNYLGNVIVPGQPSGYHTECAHSSDFVQKLNAEI